MSHVCMMLTADLEPYLAGLAGNGCLLKRDRDAGTVVALDDDTPVLKAIQKGRGGPWIVRFIDSDRIQWTRPEAKPGE